MDLVARMVAMIAPETSPAYMRGGSCYSLNASGRSRRRNRLLVGIGRTFKPTRSGTGSFAGSQQAHALGEWFPFIRALLQALHHGSQARLHAHPGTFPHMAGDAGDSLLRFQVGKQEGRVQISL